MAASRTSASAAALGCPAPPTPTAQLPFSRAQARHSSQQLPAMLNSIATPAPHALPARSHKACDNVDISSACSPSDDNAHPPAVVPAQCEQSTGTPQGALVRLGTRGEPSSTAPRPITAAEPSLAMQMGDDHPLIGMADRLSTRRAAGGRPTNRNLPSQPSPGVLTPDLLQEHTQGWSSLW